MSKKGPGLERVRNIGIAAHIDAGKTTLTERVLYYTGANHRIGEVHDAQAHMDYLPEERAHGITITTAVTQCPWMDHLIQVVDTPGHVDFTIEVERAMRVLDGAVIVLDGVRGVEPQTETVWRQADGFNIPRMFFVNKMDRPGASYQRSLETLTERLGANPVPVCVPVDEGVLHLVDQQLVTFHGDRNTEVRTQPIPEHYADLVAEYRETLLLTAAEADPELEEAVLEEREVEPDRIWSALRLATLAGMVHPVFGGSALRDLGVQPLLDGMVHLLPSPLDRPPPTALDEHGQEQVVDLDSDGTLAALAFKVQLWDGRRHVFARLYRGRLSAGDKVQIARNGVVERAARVFDVDANSKRRLDQARAGQIVLLAGLREATTGDTLCSPGHPVHLESIQAREPVLGLAVEPETGKDEEKLVEVLDKVCQEDPTLRYYEDEETGQRILSGMGELHLQIVFERIRREFNVAIRSGKPRVMTRETIAGPGEADTLLDRVLKIGVDETLHLKARARVRVTPTDRDGGIHTHTEPRTLPPDSRLSRDQEDAVRHGLDDALAGGPLEGAPLQDITAEVMEVELFGTASSPQALRMATSRAAREAMALAGGQRMQPLMNVEVVVPDENFGSVLGDLQARQTTITDTDTDQGMGTIRGLCPLSSLLGYTTDLRSMTRGRGQFTMEFCRFDVA